MTQISKKEVIIISGFLLLLASTTFVEALSSQNIVLSSQGTIHYFSKTAQISETRGVLVKSISAYPHDDNLICQTLASYGFNAVYLEVNPYAWTGASLDDIPSMLAACNTYGLQLHILFLFYGYSSQYNQAANENQFPYGFGGSNPDWRMVDSSNNTVNWCCFQRQSTRDRVKQVIQTMLTFYPTIVDINFDYVRVPESAESEDNYALCYCDQCKAAFKIWLAANYPSVSSANPPDADWTYYQHGYGGWKYFAEWRCIPINNMIRDARQWGLEVNPNLIFTADVWGPNYWGGGPDYYKELLAQDSAYWISQGWLDAVNPMWYSNGVNGSMIPLSRVMPDWQQYWMGATTSPYKGAIQLVPFITQGGNGNGNVGSALTTSNVVEQINYLRQMGCNGFIFWRYVGPGLTAGGSNNITPYLAAIQNSSAKGAFPVFEQARPTATGSTITWETSLPTTGKVEFKADTLFPNMVRAGARLPYYDIDYANGTIVSETVPTKSHSLTVPLSPPFYYRIIDNDTSVELASPVYLVTG